jgi:hypothetical protein
LVNCWLRGIVRPPIRSPQSNRDSFYVVPELGAPTDSHLGVVPVSLPILKKRQAAGGPRGEPNGHFHRKSGHYQRSDKYISQEPPFAGGHLPMDTLQSTLVRGNVTMDEDIVQVEVHTSQQSPLLAVPTRPRYRRYHPPQDRLTAA